MLCLTGLGAERGEAPAASDLPAVSLDTFALTCWVSFFSPSSESETELDEHKCLKNSFAVHTSTTLRKVGDFKILFESRTVHV